MGKNIRVAVVGATGAVGRELLKVIEERNVQLEDIILLADPQEAGTQIPFKGNKLTVQAAGAEHFAKAQLAFFAVGTDISKALAPLARKNNCLVIDNSYAFRLDNEVPLVVPEVNIGDIAGHKGIIANPNCSTIIMAVAVNPIFRAFGLKRIIVSTYQAVSGAGIAGIEELKRNIQADTDNEVFEPKVFQYPIAFNVIPHIDEFVEAGYTREEMKMVYETRKILHYPDLPIVATTVRVPVYRSHSESINLEMEKEADIEEIRALMSEAPGIILQDDPSGNL
ncbi:MAG: aspartate-semialdehyde dehydrogenase, partial [Syntrophomonadaceae bacterium]|nr:aspartate-semialdehyde dehydrogenase [Syntrophomonadaceae bacterium]